MAGHGVDMSICPNCKYEYTAGEIECIDCGVALVDGLPDDVEPDDVAGHLVPFRRFGSRVYAEVVRESLANEGISAVIKTEGSHEEQAETVETGAGGKAVLWIPEDEIEQATIVADSIVRQG